MWSSIQFWDKNLKAMKSNVNKMYIVLFTVLASSSIFAGSPDNFTGQWLKRGFQALERIQNHNSRGDDYGDFCESLGYVRGVAMSGDGVWWDLPPHNTGDQLEAVIMKYMNAHPEQWGDNADDIIKRSFKMYFPISHLN